MDWGTVPAWVGAIGTIAAFTVTFMLLLLEIRQRRAEVHELQMRQARLVWAAELGMKTSSSDQLDDHVRVEVRPAVHNDSDEPIRDPIVRVYDERGQLLGDAGLAGRNSVGPHDDEKLYLSVHIPNDRDLGGRGTQSDLFFTDAGGRRWVRTRNDLTPKRVLEG